MKLNTLFFLSFFVSMTLVFDSCKNSNNESEKELELREKELELKEKELDLQRNSNNSFDYVEEKRSSSNNNSYTPKPRQATADDLREDLYQKEKKNPIDYLSVSYSLNYKVLSGKDEIIGTIYNYATLASFKDIKLTVTYISGTDTEISRETFVVYDYVYAGSSTNFNIKTFSPEGTKKIGVKVNSATGE